MIFYFSGTGNSQLAAKQIAEITKDELVSINRALKEGGQNKYMSRQPLVFVAPTYAWRMPKVVEKWIRRTSFEGSRDVYFVLTCGGDCGNAAAYARKVCKEKGLHFCGLASVVMPENYVALFETPPESECRAILDKAVPQIAELAVQIQKGSNFPQTSQSFKSRLNSGPVNTIFYPLLVHDKGFTVSDQCISCQKCVQRCPLSNISMKNNKPVWNGNCTHCMACIGGCPTAAIEYKKNSKGQHRYYIMED